MILIIAEIESRRHSTQKNKFRSWYSFEFENHFHPGVGAYFIFDFKRVALLRGFTVINLFTVFSIFCYANMKC